MTEKKDTGPKAQYLKTFFANECEGVTSIEYGIIAGSLSIAIVASVNALGSEVVNLFASVLGIF